MIVGGIATSASDRLTGVTKGEDEGAGDGSNVEPVSGNEDDMANAEFVDSKLKLNADGVVPIKSDKSEIASNLEMVEGTPTVINLPLNQNSGMSGSSGGTPSSKQDSQPIPNIPSSDFANTSIVMAESMFNLSGDV